MRQRKKNANQGLVKTKVNPRVIDVISTSYNMSRTWKANVVSEGDRKETGERNCDW